MTNQKLLPDAVTVLLLVVVLPGAAIGRQQDANVGEANETAHALFEAGQFAMAGQQYAAAAARDPNDYQAILRLGEIALLANRLDDAEQWLQRAVALKSNDKAPKLLLAEAYYRRDQFAKAAPLLRAAGEEARARKLESFQGQMPYLLEGSGDATSLKFVETQPLPLVNVRINGGDEVTFFLDTGASEMILDTEFARELGIEQLGSVQGTFAGGIKSEVGNGRIDSLTLGSWTVKNVPVSMLGLRGLSEDLGGHRIDGAIGTVVFYHFLTTLDYPNEQLILRRRTEQNRRRFEATWNQQSVTVPYWMADSHFMVTPARINGHEPTLLFVDTGLASAGVKLGKYAVEHNQIKLLEDQAFESAGGGGKFRSVPFTLQSLAIGAAEERNVKGLFEGPFPWLHTFGFRLVGMVGHEYFAPYAVTFDFDGMRMTLQRGPLDDSATDDGKANKASHGPARSSMVTVEPGVELEVVDWGGTGETMVLLAGLGDNAHVFDYFAHQFTDRFHVIGITRRGFGRSSQPADGYDVDTRARDDIAVLDMLGIPKAVFVGHSIAGDELSALGSTYPDRVAKLVYLDALEYGRPWSTLPQPPGPEYSDADLASIERYAAAEARKNGIRKPMSALCNLLRTDDEGAVVDTISPPEIAQKIVQNSRQAAYDQVSVPALGIFVPLDHGPAYVPYYAELSRDQQEEFDRCLAQLQAWQSGAIERFRAGVKDAHSVELPGSNHYVFLRDEPRVVREMRRFLLDE